MGIFSSIFKKNKLNSEILSLVNLQDSIIMPPDAFFENTKNKELCEQYYQEYKEILSSKKTVLSTHLKDSETDDIRVYIDILTSLELHIHDILDNPNKHDYSNDYVNNILARLNTYSLILNSIEEESFLRLASLSSLKSTPFLSRSKKNAIDNEISRLQIQIFNTQKINNLIKMQLNACISIIQNLHLYKDKDFIMVSNYRLNNYLQAYGITINEENIIYQQVKLEKHLFKNKNILTDLNKEFKILLNNAKLNRKDRISKINILIDKYMAIKEYKRIEDPNLLYSLVKYKVDSYEIDYNTYGEILSGTANYLEEKEILKEIFFKKVNNFMQNSEIFERYVKYDFYRNNYREFANIINKLLKSNEGNYDYENVIKTPILTGLLYSIDDPVKMKNYFKYFKIHYFYLPYIAPLFEWEEWINLETIMRSCDKLLSYEIIQSIANPQINLLYQIYKCLLGTVIKEISNNYIYAGAKEFNINFDYIHFRSYQKFIKEYNKIMREGKKLTFPKTLKRIAIDNNIRYHDDNLKAENIELFNYYEFELNEGLEELILLDITSFNNNPNELEIPTTLKKIKLENINPACLTFKDYTESSLVNIISKDKEAFKEFINNIGNTQKLKFKGKTSVTTFSLNLEKLKKENQTDVDTIYNLFQEKIKEKYNQLYKIATFLGCFLEKEEETLENLKGLENSLKDFLSKNLDEIKTKFTLPTFENNNDKYKLFAQIQIISSSLTYIIETFPSSKNELEKINNLIQKYKNKIKFEIILEKSLYNQKPLINEDTSTEEKEIFKAQLQEKIRNNTEKIYKLDTKDNNRLWLLQELNEIINKYKDKQDKYEFLLANPFLLELLLSLVNQNDELIFDIFRKYTINKDNRIIKLFEFYTSTYENQISYNCIIDEVLKHDYKFDLFDKSITLENFIRDLIPIFEKVKPTDTYYIGEGIKIYSVRLDLEKGYFARQSENKNIIFPNSLKSFDYYSSLSNRNIKIKSLTIGKSLELLNLEDITLDHLVIPDYVHFLYRTGKVTKITFLDFENSLILTKEDTCRVFIKGFICFYNKYDFPTLIPIIKNLKAKSIILKSTNGTIKEISIDKFIPKDMNEVETMVNMKYSPLIIDKIYNCIQHELQIAKKENKNLTRKRKR